MKIHKFVVLLAGVCLSLSISEAGAQTRILNFGDSIISSSALYASYRYALWHRLQAAGFDVDFVGSQSGVTGGTPANTDYDQDHEGHPGWTTQDARGSIGSVAGSTQPDITIVDLGSNDVTDGIPIETAMENLQAIIDTLRQVNPAVTIILAQPTNFEGADKREMSKLRRAIGKLARAANESDSRVIALNLAGGFSVRKHTFDGIHPNELGEERIAKKYFSVLRRLLRRMGQ